MQEYNKYDLEPVRYCSKCYSLQIGSVEGIEDSDYCMHCGCSEIKTTSIQQWERMYEERYGHKYVEKHTDPKRRALYKLTTEELKEKLYNEPSWKWIIKQIYPAFPDYLGRADSILLFFDKLMKEKRQDELREILITKE